MPFLEIYRREKPVATHRFQDREVQIGRSSRNDLALLDETISRHHAVLVLVEGGYVIRDLSTNGTFVNGKRIRTASLRERDRIDIGTYSLIFREKTLETHAQGLLGVEPSKRTAVVRSARESRKPSVTKEHGFQGMIGRSQAMRALFDKITRTAGSDASVHVCGETGVGKELAARAIHSLSRRASGPFEVVNCAAIPTGLLESEFFGHVRGAFTGAHADRAGVFERAHGGTLFLDEIGDMPWELQPKLLRVIEDKWVARMGEGCRRLADFRLITATNRSLEDAVDSGTFRQDLFFRIHVVPVRIPPLRDRREDIVPIAEHLLLSLSKNGPGGSSVYRLSDGAKQKLASHAWPGNVRELKNALERAILSTETEEIGPDDLEFLPVGKVETGELARMGSLSLEEAEKRLIRRTLEVNRGNKRKTSLALGIAYSTLWSKMKKYGIVSSRKS